MTSVDIFDKEKCYCRSIREAAVKKTSENFGTLIYVYFFLLHSHFIERNVITFKGKYEDVCILVAQIPPTLVKLSDRILFPLRAAKSIPLPVGRNIHPSDATDQQRDEKVEGSERVLGRQNQDIRAVDNPLDLFRHYFFTKPPSARGSHLKAETHSGRRGVTFLPLCPSLVGSRTYTYS